MNVKISVFVIGVEATTYLLLYNLHDCTFKLANYSGLRLKGKYYVSFLCKVEIFQ